MSVRYCCRSCGSGIGLNQYSTSGGYCWECKRLSEGQQVEADLAKQLKDAHAEIVRLKQRLVTMELKLTQTKPPCPTCHREYCYPRLP